MIITVIGRGHSGTRAMSHTLSESSVYMGAQLNGSGDLIPPDDLYEACRVFAKHVTFRRGLEWDFDGIDTMPIDPAFIRLVESYLGSVLSSAEPLKGWKLPETALILPWIVRLFPDIKYIYWLRDPRDSIIGHHLTDDLADFGIDYERTDDIRCRRAISWIYQYKLMLRTPSPANRIDVNFEDFVYNQDSTLDRLSKFLGFPLAKIEARKESVGRWRTDSEQHDFDFFPIEALYNAPPEDRAESTL
jgi:hypothetical protein